MEKMICRQGMADTPKAWIYCSPDPVVYPLWIQ